MCDGCDRLVVALRKGRKAAQDPPERTPAREWYGRVGSWRAPDWWSFGGRKFPDGVVYVLHGEGRRGRLAHYVGHTYRPVWVRFAEHLSGGGAIRTGRWLAEGGRWELVGWAPGSVRVEQYLAPYGLALCPVCQKSRSCAARSVRSAEFIGSR